MSKISKKGVTLIEMIIVLVIIGILIAALMNFTNSVNYAKIQTTVGQLNKIQKAVNDYMTTKKGIASYLLLNQNSPDWNNPVSSDSIWKQYFGGHILKNGFGKPWDININNAGELVISSDVRSTEACQKIQNSIKNQVSNAQCDGTILKVYYDDGN